jgi:hypothetical protein
MTKHHPHHGHRPSGFGAKLSEHRRVRCSGCHQLLQSSVEVCPYCLLPLKPKHAAAAHEGGSGPVKSHTHEPHPPALDPARPAPAASDNDESGQHHEAQPFQGHVFAAPPEPAVPSQPASARPAPKMRCPACTNLVTLPAASCPSCQVDLRTGFLAESEEELETLRRKKALKLFLLSLLWIIIGLVIFHSENMRHLARAACYGALGLEICAPDQPLNALALARANLFNLVARGYDAWMDEKTFRTVSGRSADSKDFTEERALRAYLLDAFGRLDESNLRAGRPLPPDQDLFALFLGEWDVVWIENGGAPDERFTAGEWIFSTVAGGMAVQDILMAPYLGQSPESDGPAPIRLITLRQFNHQRKVWEGVRLEPLGMTPVMSRVGQSGGLEEFSVNGPGEVTLRRFVDFTPDSFRLLVSVGRSSVWSAASHRPVGELWAKKRVLITQ